MKLDVFIIPHSCEGRTQEDTIESFGKIPCTFYTDCTTYEDINKHHKDGDWYMVIYDNEYIDEDVQFAIPVFIDCEDYDCLILHRFKVNNKHEKSPRIFRKHLKLQPNSLFPAFQEGGIAYETVLDGWIKPTEGYE